MSKVEIKFNEKRKITAVIEGFEVKTDQPVSDGGDGTAPSPFDLFLAALSACSASYASNFFKSRKLSMEGFKMEMNFEWSDEKHRLESVDFILTLPHDFPDKYIEALKNTIELCTIRKTIADPPEFKTIIEKVN
jgi:ribosomal protein S12 methylthiotransferase accessory factor